MVDNDFEVKVNNILVFFLIYIWILYELYYYSKLMECIYKRIWIWYLIIKKLNIIGERLNFVIEVWYFISIMLCYKFIFIII